MSKTVKWSMANIALHRKNSETTDCADFTDGKDKKSTSAV